MENYLFQKIVHKQSGKELDLSFLTEGKLVETMDLTGPRLMLTFRDPHRYISDELNMNECDQLTVTLADAYSTDEMSSVMEFTVLTRPKVATTVDIEALHSIVYNIKVPAAKAKAFVRRGASSLISHFFPNMQPEIGKFPVIEDYHLLPGDRASTLLKQFAQEQGGCMFVQRDKICFKKIDDLFKSAKAFVYENNNPKAMYRIIQYVEPSAKALVEDKVIRNVSGWNETKGWLKSTVNTSAPVLTHPVQSLSTINNASSGLSPVMDFTCAGNGKIKAGDVIEMRWNTQINERPLDESMPEKILVREVLHHYTTQKYYCRVKGVKPIERY